MYINYICLYMEYFYNNTYFKGFYHVSFYKNAKVAQFPYFGKTNR